MSTSQLRRRFVRILLGARDELRHVRARLVPVNEQPIFVIGHQKSGTSAIGALLARATASSVTLDLRREIRNLRYVDVVTKRMPIDDFVALYRVEFGRDIIKEPGLTLLHHELSRRFPSARWVFVVRDPRDTIRSLLDRLSLPGDRSEIPAEVWQSIGRAWQRNLDVRWLGLDAETYVEALAARWSHFARVYLGAPARMQLVRYEEFIADKAGSIRRLAESLGLRVRVDLADTLEHAYQPPGARRSVPWREFFGSENLSAIERRCAPEMEPLGYLPSTALIP